MSSVEKASHGVGNLAADYSGVRHSLVDHISALARELLGIDFVAVHASGEEWGQFSPAHGERTPEFCRLVQGSRHGAEYCRMCHVLISVASSGESATLQRCHAGASILVTPLAEIGNDSVAVLSTCLFVPGAVTGGWKEVRNRGAKMGIDLGKFKTAYERLPRLDQKKIGVAGNIMMAAREAVLLIKAGERLEQRANELEATGKAWTHEQIEAELREQMTLGLTGVPEGIPVSRLDGEPALIRVIKQIVGSKPWLPYSVDSIAAAARLSPNHFSTMFRKSHGQCFVEYLTDKRIKLAEQLLSDVRLNISEVSARVGYNDPGYFARVFKKRTGMSPRAWRLSKGTA